MPRKLLAGCVALAMIATVAPLGGVAVGVTFRTDDGRTIVGTLFESSRRPAPAVVLVPMLGRSRADWAAVGEELSAEGITALSVDLPGQQLPGDARSLADWHRVVTGAIGYLAGRPDVRSSALGVAGASLGASLAALAAAGDGRIRALALVSPSIDYRGVRIDAAMRQFGSRPALLMASRHDPYAARSVRELAAEASGLREVQWAETVAHGTILLAREPALTRALVDWFRQTIP